MNVHSGSYQATLSAAAAAEQLIDSPLEGYLTRIEHALRADALGEAVPLAAALPHICSLLEHANGRGSQALCIRWCESWLEQRSAAAESRLGEPLLHRLNTIGIIPRQRPCATREEFDERVCRALIEGARDWYQQSGD